MHGTDGCRSQSPTTSQLSSNTSGSSSSVKSSPLTSPLLGLVCPDSFSLEAVAVDDSSFSFGLVSALALPSSELEPAPTVMLMLIVVLELAPPAAPKTPPPRHL